MEIICYIMLILCLFYHSMISFTSGDGSIKFNVVNYGAVGDGEADDTEAFREAWNNMCNADMSLPTMLIPGGMIFYLNPISFKGPCRSRYLKLQIDGTIVAPEDPIIWNDTDPSLWIEFYSVNGLQVTGLGDSAFQIDGRGSNWWKQSCKLNPKKGCTKLAPTALRFINCQDLWVRDLSITNSSQTHILVRGCTRVRLQNLNIEAPGNSPNTDGIHIHASNLVVIQKTKIGTGDDCISIGDRISNIDIENISCGPGHGISIGSLGKGGANVSVEGIRASHVNLHGTTNGARIKTWQGGGGYARSISFEYFNFYNVRNPIIIDQYYCDVRGKCPDQTSAVKISNVRYANMHGTSDTPIAVSLNCSRSVSCDGLHFANVNVISSNPSVDAGAYCINAYGDTAGFINPDLSCLQNDAGETNLMVKYE